MLRRLGTWLLMLFCIPGVVITGLRYRRFRREWLMWWQIVKGGEL